MAWHLSPGDKALWVASRCSAGAEWTEVFRSGLVPDAAEAQLCTISCYDLPGETVADNFLQYMLQLGDFAWELRNHRMKQLIRMPRSVAAQVHRWLTAAEGDSPSPRHVARQGLRGFPLAAGGWYAQHLVGGVRLPPRREPPTLRCRPSGVTRRPVWM